MLQNLTVGNVIVVNLSELKMVISCNWEATLIVSCGALMQNPESIIQKYDCGGYFLLYVVLFMWP